MTQRSLRKRLLPWLPATLYMLLIWTLSSFPMVTSVEEVPFKDKGVHFVEYGVLAVLLCYALRGSFPERSLRFALFYGALGTVLWGLLDEIHQAYVPSRSADPRDVMADVLGALLGAGVYALFQQVRRKRARRDPAVTEG